MEYGGNGLEPTLFLSSILVEANLFQGDSVRDIILKELIDANYNNSTNHFQFFSDITRRYVLQAGL